MSPDHKAVESFVDMDNVAPPEDGTDMNIVRNRANGSAEKHSGPSVPPIGNDEVGHSPTTGSKNVDRNIAVVVSRNKSGVRGGGKLATA